MSKKKALFLYEMRTMKWIYLGGAVAAVLFCLLVEAKVSGNYGYEDLDMLLPGSVISLSVCETLVKAMPVVMLSLAIMTVVQFWDIHRKKTHEYILSLPYTRTGRIAAKMIAGYGALTMTALIVAVGILTVRSAHIDDVYRAMSVSPHTRLLLGTETVWHTLRILCTLWLLLLAVYSIMMLIHMMISNGILASITGIGVAVAPFCPWAVVHQVLFNMSLQDKAYKEAAETWYGLANYFLMFAGFDFGDRAAVNVNGQVDVVYYPDFWVVFLVSLAVAAACAVMSIVLFRKNDMAKDGMMVQSSGARVFLSAGISFCFASGISAWFCYIEWERILLRPFALIGVAVMAVLYIICFKLFARTSK